MQTCTIVAMHGSETQATCEASDPQEVPMQPASASMPCLWLQLQPWTSLRGQLPNKCPQAVGH